MFRFEPIPHVSTQAPNRAKCGRCATVVLKKEGYIDRRTKHARTHARKQAHTHIRMNAAALYSRVSFQRIIIVLVGQTGASPPTGHVHHLALTYLHLCFGNSGNNDTVADSSVHFPRKYEACKSKTETLRDEIVFLS